ncbi:hypothetical protein Tco_0000811 [Tanacetum coccineum]
MTFNDRTVDYDKLERKLNETIGLLAQKEIDIKEGLKLKAYEILVVKEKHDELVKQSLLTKLHYEGLVKEKTKVITDFKLKEEKDIDKMISMEKQLKFLNEIVYKRNQSIQTIHMLAPKGPTFNGRPTFVNPIELVDQAWEKHSHNHFRAPTALDMEVLIKTCLMPLAIKTQNDSFTFVHELKQEMHADLKYVESLENEIDKLESDKAEFSNMYDTLLQECMSNDVMCSYLNSLSDLDAHSKLQCLYVHKVKECKCLEQNLSKQTKTVSKEVYNELSRSFSKLEKHSISLELALQQCQEQMKNDTVCKEKASNIFLKEREQYFEIQDLKAQLQDKNIAISELKKLIEKMKVTPHSKPYDVNAPGPSRKSPKHVSFQSPREFVGSNDMVHNYNLEEAKKKAQLQKDKALDTKPSMQQSARLPNTTNGRIFTQVGLKWIPIRKSVETRCNTNDSASPLGKETHNPKTVICANSSSLSAGDFGFRHKVTLKEYDQKSALYLTMYANKSFNRNSANHKLYHALMEALIKDENAMDKGVANLDKDHKRKHDDDENDDDKDTPAGPNQGKKTKRGRTKESESSKNPSTTKETPKGKAPSKGSKTGKSASAKEPIKEPIAEVVMDDASDDVVHNDYQPQDTPEPKTTKNPNP